MAAVRNRVVPALVLTAMLACLTSCTVKHEKVSKTVPTNGPLVGDSTVTGGAIRAKRGEGMFLLGVTQLNNTGTKPVRIVGVRTWGGEQMALTEADLITGPKAPPGGLGRGRGSLAAQERAARIPASASQRLVGALLEPCCHPKYFLALAYRITFPPAPTHPPIGFIYVQAGYVHGVEITYELADGRRYRTLVDASLTFCTGENTDDQCQRVEHTLGAVEQAGLETQPPVAALTAKGTWHEH
jgi:hypothetical protein